MKISDLAVMPEIPKAATVSGFIHQKVVKIHLDEISQTEVSADKVLEMVEFDRNNLARAIWEEKKIKNIGKMVKKILEQLRL